MKKLAQHRLTVLRFCQAHGTAACAAFKVSRRTLHRWRQTRKHNPHNPAALAPRSRARKRRRRGTVRLPRLRVLLLDRLAPSGLIATAGTGQIVLAWTAPLLGLSAATITG